MLRRVPVGFAMGIAGVAGFAAVNGIGPGLNLPMNAPYRRASDDSLSVIPMFVLTGVFASAGGISREFIHANKTQFGRLRGGAAISTILACAGLAAINGSPVATAATMTTVALPGMKRKGCDPGIAAGPIAAGRMPGIMIPPSVVMPVCANLTEQDAARRFLAGVIPGLLAVEMHVCTIRVPIWRRPHLMPVGRRGAREERMKTLKEVRATLLPFCPVVMAMHGGFLTVTEAAGVGAVVSRMLWNFLATS